MLTVETYLYAAQIVMGIAIIVLVLLQAKDAGMGNVFGGNDMGVYKTRRGVEKTLFNATVGLGIAFLVMALISVVIAG